MVEEMYKEEAGDAEMDSNSSSENATKAVKGDVRSSDDIGEDLQQSASSTGTERCSTGQFMDPKSAHVPDIEMAGSNGSIPLQSGSRHEAVAEYGLLKRKEGLRPGMDDNLFSNAMVQPDGSNDRFMAAAAAYHMSELGRFGSGSGVSLTLGLQHCDGGSLPISSGSQHSFVTMRGDEIYNAAASSVGPGTADFECLNSGNQQSRFSSSHLLHDFVV